jgi:hypothetical protein
MTLNLVALNLKINFNSLKQIYNTSVQFKKNGFKKNFVETQRRWFTIKTINKDFILTVKAINMSHKSL